MDAEQAKTQLAELVRLEKAADSSEGWFTAGLIAGLVLAAIGVTVGGLAGIFTAVGLIIAVNSVKHAIKWAILEARIAGYPPRRELVQAIRFDKTQNRAEPAPIPSAETA